MRMVFLGGLVFGVRDGLFVFVSIMVAGMMMLSGSKLDQGVCSNCFDSVIVSRRMRSDLAV